jgi:two-component system response regulator YesN
MSLFGSFFEDREHFESKREELGIELSFDSFVVCYCELNKQGADETNDESHLAHLAELYTNAARMAKETIANITTCYITNLNTSNFIITFCLDEQESASHRQVLGKVIEPAIQIIKNYFNVDLSCTVGARVSCPLQIHSSYYSARRALDENDREKPLHFCGDNQISLPTPASKTGKPVHKSHTVEKIKEYIRENLDKRLTLNQVSEKFGFSPKYISLLFAKHAECSFVEYINAEKMARAGDLLLSNNAMVYEVSEKLGFENAFYFSKVFKKHYGVSPREFVKRIEN